MKLLLDTHAFLWWITDDPSLSAAARRMISDESSVVLFSAASAWEIAIKFGMGKLSLADDGDLTTFIDTHVRTGRMVMLPVTVGHALAVHRLPHHHRDPFGRLLVAQAQAEDALLLTNDQVLAQYDVQVAW